jgi:hypothetical protein
VCAGFLQEQAGRGQSDSWGSSLHGAESLVIKLVREMLWVCHGVCGTFERAPLDQVYNRTNLI